MTDSIKAALIINDKCLDIEGLILEEGKGFIALREPMDLVAGELSAELLQALQLPKEATRRKHTHAHATESAHQHSGLSNK